MSVLVVLIPVSLFLGAVGLVACLWTMRAGQYDDLDGAAARILIDPETPTDDDAETACNRPT